VKRSSDGVITCGASIYLKNIFERQKIGLRCNPLVAERVQ
jgi:hypothetical protein